MGNIVNILIDGKYIGHLNLQKKTFFKEIRAEEHILKKPGPAIATAEKALEYAQGRGCVYHVVVVWSGKARKGKKGTKRTVYKTTIENIWWKGFNVTRGFERQKALSLAYWDDITQGEQRELI